MVTADSVKAKIQALIAKANSTTGKSDTDLTSGVNSLVDGYGQGDPVPVWDEDFTLSDDTEEITGREPLLKEKTITANDTYLASADGADGYSKVIVNVAGGGGGGESTLEYIIEVDVLPTDSAAIDKNALYKCGRSYYMWAPFKDMILVIEGQAMLYSDLLSMTEPDSAFALEFYYVNTRPTENIVVSYQLEDGGFFAFYYVEDENDILLYGDVTQTGKNEWMSIPFKLGGERATVGGAITDISQATQDNTVYALIDDSNWREYVAPSGNRMITESGTYDVTRKKSVKVDIPDAAVCGVWRFNEDIGGVDDINQDVNFTTIKDGNTVTCTNMDYKGTGPAGDPAWLDYNGLDVRAWGHGINGWCCDSVRTVDFGAEPQLVSSAFKEWLVANATPIYNTSSIPIEISTESEMTALLESAEVGSVYKYTGTTGTYENGALYVVEAVTE